MSVTDIEIYRGSKTRSIVPYSTPIKNLSALHRASKRDVALSVASLLGCEESTKRLSYIEQYGILERRLRSVTPLHSVSYDPQKSTKVKPVNSGRSLHRDCCNNKAQKYVGQEWATSNKPLAGVNIYYEPAPALATQIGAAIPKFVQYLILLLPVFAVMILTVLMWLGEVMI